MKFRVLRTAALLLCVVLCAGFSSAFGKVPQKFPSAFLPETRYVFSPVVEGAHVVHDFIIKNNGTAPLKIEKVKTG